MPITLYVGLTKKFLLLFLLCTGWVHLRSRSRPAARLERPGLILLGLWLVIFGIAIQPMDHDEVEHLHCTWLVSQGQVPLRDFWQHHSPMMYLVLAPLMKLPVDRIYIPFAARGSILLLTLGMAALSWRMARELWGESARPDNWLLGWAAVLVPMELFTPRPDTFATLLVLAGILWLMRTGRHDNARYLAAGLLQGIGLTFSPKLYLVLLAPVLVSLWHLRWRALPRIASYGLGVGAGCVPLLAYLIRHDLMQDFRDWVIRFNLRHQVPYGMDFNPVLVGVGLLGCRQLLRQWRRTADERVPLFLLFYGFVGFSAVRSPLIRVAYYAAPWMILTVVMASRFSFGEVLDRLGRTDAWHSAAAGLCIAVVLSPVMLTFAGRPRDDLHPTENWRSWSMLCRLSEHDTAIALAPFHPVFANDAIGLYGDWQATFSYLDDRVRRTLARRDICASILRTRPAVICEKMSDGRQDMLGFLADTGLVTPPERDQLARFLRDNYTLVRLGRPFRVRNDLLKRLGSDNESRPGGFAGAHGRNGN
jgi:hypothetical protein